MGYNKLRNDPKRPKMSQSNKKQAKTIQKSQKNPERDLNWPKTTSNESKRPTRIPKLNKNDPKETLN